MVWDPLSDERGRDILAMGHRAWASGKHPFADTVDREIFYRSPVHQGACAELFAAAKTHGGLLVLSGEPGTGKTIVLHRVARDLEEAGVRVLWFSDVAPLHEVLCPVVRTPGASDAGAPGSAGAGLLAALQARVRAERATVVAIDEAQRLEPAELRALRVLAEAPLPGTRLAILLIGQPELEVKLASLAGDDPDRACSLHIRLSRLETPDVRAYMAYRLEQVGLRFDDVFEADAVERIAADSGGIPRLINQLCDAALYVAGRAGFKTVSASGIDAAGRWLDLEPPADSVGRGARASVERARQWAAAGGRAAGQWVGTRGAEVRAFAGTMPAIGRGVREQLRHASRSAAAIGRAKTPWQLRVWTVGVGAVVLFGGVVYLLRHDVSPPPRKVATPTTANTPRSLASEESTTPRVAERPSLSTGAPEQPPRSGRDAARKPLASAEKGPPTEARSVPKPPPVPVTPRTVSRRSHGILDAAETGSLIEVRTLLDWGVPTDARDESGMTPLMAAVTHGHEAVVGLLLARGADVNAANDRGVTPLMLAANNDRTALLQTLLGRGAQVNARNRDGWTALTYAAWKGHANMVRRLLAAGGNPSIRDRRGWTPLQYAAWRAAGLTPTKPREPGSQTEDASESREAARLRYTDLIALLEKVTPPR